MTECEKLDDYLDGDLTPAQASRFREHTEVCGECRANLEAMTEFAEIVSEAKSSFDDWYQNERRVVTPNAMLVRPENAQYSQQSQHSIGRRLFVSAAVIAATLSIVFAARKIATLSSDTNGQREIVVTNDGANPAPSEMVNGADRAKRERLTKATVRTRPGSGYLAQPIESSNPNITIVWLHPTTEVAEPETEPDSSATPEQETDLLARRTI